MNKKIILAFVFILVFIGGAIANEYADVITFRYTPTEKIKPVENEIYYYCNGEMITTTLEEDLDEDDINRAINCNVSVSEIYTIGEKKLMINQSSKEVFFEKTEVISPKDE